MLMQADRSCLLVIDIQDKLIPAIHQGAEVVANSAWLMRIAQRLEVPLLVSEQYPQGLGHTVAELQPLLPSDGAMTKLTFSCSADAGCLERITALHRPQLVLTGIEAHVCVLQTALGLLAHGREVFVVADAVSSRQAQDKALALERMRAEGVKIVSREMVVFEWLKQAGTEVFRAISREFLR
ncbi:MAG TPA: hydrolase [Candidatus Competibacteraceae bacterium]|nr:hydrolase [Candidatus Competibacteraceae bacterium]